MPQPLDRRLHAYREDLADARLEGQVDAKQFVTGRPAWVTAAPSTPLRPAPGLSLAYDTELLFGEAVRIFEDALPADDGIGWAWVQAQRDGYVGYCPSASLSAGETPQPTHFLSVARSQRYAAPRLKLPPQDILTMGAEVTVVGMDGKYAALQDGSFVYADHLRPIDQPETDPASVALRLLETPYVWGGKSGLGFDCSALVQLSLQACGIACPRDTDMQAAMTWDNLPTDSGSDELQRNDLIFWTGHVGMMLNGAEIIHANATDMSTRIWSLDILRDHILKMEGNTVSRILRKPLNWMPLTASSDAPS